MFDRHLFYVTTEGGMLSTVSLSAIRVLSQAGQLQNLVGRTPSALTLSLTRDSFVKGMRRAGNACKNAGSNRIKAPRIAVTRGHLKDGPGPETIAIKKAARATAAQAAKTPRQRAAGLGSPGPDSITPRRSTRGYLKAGPGPGTTAIKKT